MDSKSSYSSPLVLSHESSSLTAGFCLSKIGLEELHVQRFDYLHPKEQSYYHTLQYPKRRYSYLLGRYCAKKAVSAFLKTNNFSDILIENGVFQQPIVYHPNFPNLQVSISHAENLGAALIFPEAHPMAIDVESVDDSKKDTIFKQLTKAEQELSITLSHPFSLWLLWTVKEALSKVIKCGLMVPFELLEVESIIQQDNWFVSHFKNFHQYQALSFILGDNICSLVYPKKTEFNIDISSIRRSLA